MKLKQLFKLLFTRDNPEAVRAGIVDYSGQGRNKEGK